jgi:hypothetical protein
LYHGVTPVGPIFTYERSKQLLAQAHIRSGRAEEGEDERERAQKKQRVKDVYLRRLQDSENLSKHLSRPLEEFKTIRQNLNEKQLLPPQKPPKLRKYEGEVLSKVEHLWKRPRLK